MTTSQSDDDKIGWRDSSLLRRCRIVLVRPHTPGNVGAVARAMKNFGVSDLRIVDPVCNLAHSDTRAMAVHGVTILDSAEVVSSIAEAIADCVMVLTTSGETGGLVRKGFWGTPEEKIPIILKGLTSGRVALIFGPEPHGLTAAEVALGQGSIFIPAANDYPSLNLSHAVTVCLYELRRQWLKYQPTLRSQPDPVAPVADQERAYEHLKAGLTAVRFLWDFRSEGKFHVLRHWLSRAQPTSKELLLLHGLASQLEYVARRWGVTHPSDGRPPPLQTETAETNSAHRELP